MRRPFLLTLVLVTFLLLAAGVVLLFQSRNVPVQPVTPDPAALAAVPRVDLSALADQLQTSTPPLVWDFRPAASFAEGHIPGSRVLTLDAIPDAAANIDKRQHVVTVCA